MKKAVNEEFLEEGDSVPAHPWEVQEAKEEGIEFIEGYSPVEFTAELFPTLTGVKFEKVTSMGKDESGQFIIETDACLGCGYSGVDPEKCLGCGLCQQLCPKGGVITMAAKGGE